MAVPSSNFFASFSLTSFRTTLFSLMMPMWAPRNTSCQWLNSWRKKGLFSRANSINGNHLSSCMSWRNTSRKMVQSTCVGVATIRWNSKIETSSIKMQKAPIDRRSLLYTHRCMRKNCNSIIASCAINCNTLLGCYV